MTNLLKTIEKEISSLGSEGVALTATIISMCKGSQTTVDSKQIGQVLKDNDELVDRSCRGSGSYARGYRILSFSDRLTRELVSLEKKDYLVLSKVKGKVCASLTDKTIELVRKITTNQKNMVMWLTSSKEFERDFAGGSTFIATASTASYKLMSLNDLIRLESLVGRSLLKKDKELFTKLQNSIRMKKISK